MFAFDIFVNVYLKGKLLLKDLCFYLDLMIFAVCVLCLLYCTFRKLAFLAEDFDMIVLIIRVIAIIIRLVHVINKAKVSEKNRKEMGNIDMGSYNDGGTDEYNSDPIEHNGEYNEEVHSKGCQSYDDVNGKSIEVLNHNGQTSPKNCNQITTITTPQKC